MRRDLKTSTRVARHLLLRDDLVTTAREVAHTLALGEATMRHKLIAEGTNYRTIYEAVRLHRAKKLVAEQGPAPSWRYAEPLGFKCWKSFTAWFNRVASGTFDDFRRGNLDRPFG